MLVGHYVTTNVNILGSRAAKKLSETGRLGIPPVAGLREKAECTKECEGECEKECCGECAEATEAPAEVVAE